MTHLVGVDVGTSAIKAVVVDADSGEQLGAARVTTPWQTRDDAVELAVASLVRAVETAVDAAVTRSGTHGISAVGITAIAESGALVDRAGTPTSPVVAWYDRRGLEQYEALCAQFGPDELSRQTGQVVAPRLSAARIRFLRDSGLPGERWLSVPELIVDGLGGRSRPDRSQWSRTGLLDITTGEALADVVEWAGLDPSQASGAVFSGTPMGVVSAHHPVSAIAGAVLTTAGHDHVAAALGAGVTETHQICDSWGNGEALVRPVISAPTFDDMRAGGCSLSWGLASGHVVFAGLGTGLTLNAVLHDLGVTPDERAALDQLAVGSDPSSSDSRAVVWRTALDSAFERVQDVIEMIESFSGRLEEVVGCGGWLKSPAIAARKAAAVRHFRASSIDEPAALGAALLAGTALAA